VEAVAGLRAGADVAHAHECATLTLLCPGRAYAELAGRAAAAAARIALVDLAVAVVVVPVADLGRRRPRRRAAGGARPVSETHHRARPRAVPDVHGAGRAEVWEHFPYAPLFLAVEAVAGLRAGGGVANTHERAALALAGPGRAHA